MQSPRSWSKLLIVGSLAGLVVIPAVAGIADGAPDPAPRATGLTPAVTHQLEASDATKYVGPSPRSFVAAEGLTRVEGNGQACSVADDRVLACGTAKGLGTAPIVDVTLAESGTISVSVLTSTDVSSVNLTDNEGRGQRVGVSAGIARASVRRGNFKLEWTTADGATHTDEVPVDKMFPTLGGTRAAG